VRLPLEDRVVQGTRCFRPFHHEFRDAISFLTPFARSDCRQFPGSFQQMPVNKLWLIAVSLWWDRSWFKPSRHEERLMLQNGHKNTGGRLVLSSSGILLVSWLCFWTPSALLHWARGQAFGALDVVSLSMAMPAVAVALSRSLPNLGSTKAARCLLPLLMLAALWIGGPAAMLQAPNTGRHCS
jgi:hypothetical protein